MGNFVKFITQEENKEWFIDVKSILAFSAIDESSCELKLMGGQTSKVNASIEKIKELTGTIEEVLPKKGIKIRSKLIE